MSDDNDLFFGQRTDFSGAFPMIDEINVEIEESGSGVAEWNKKSHYSKSTLTNEYIRCSNPRCRNGGFSLESIIREMFFTGKLIFETSTLCEGYEGSPKGRIKGKKCINYFKIKVTIKLKDDKSE
jgi:hypothetical protein